MKLETEIALTIHYIHKIKICDPKNFVVAWRVHILFTVLELHDTKFERLSSLQRYSTSKSTSGQRRKLISYSITNDSITNEKVLDDNDGMFQ